MASKWDDVIYPGMKAAVINTMIATQERSESRKVHLITLSAVLSLWTGPVYHSPTCLSLLLRLVVH